MVFAEYFWYSKEKKRRMEQTSLAISSGYRPGAAQVLKEPSCREGNLPVK
jgi:hypothetical protein